MRCEHFFCIQGQFGFWSFRKCLMTICGCFAQWAILRIESQLWRHMVEISKTNWTFFFFLMSQNFFLSLPFLLPQVYSLKFMITMATYFFNLIPVILSKKPQNKRKARIFVWKKTIWNTFVLQLRTLNFELGNPMSYEYVGIVYYG